MTQTIEPEIDNLPSLSVPPVTMGMGKKTSLLKTSGDKEKKKKGALKVGFSIEEDVIV